ncbi:MAG: hypothetical protein ABL962_04260, partial [Fimbriimonadaceae bacterium]
MPAWDNDLQISTWWEEWTGRELIRPLVIDLAPGATGEGDGLDFLTLDSSPVFYDYDGDGYRERTAWVGPHEGIVAWDKDNDGKVDRNEIVLTNGDPDALTDLHALIRAGLDGDNNGVITAVEASAAGKRLLIWIDKNQDGIADGDADDTDPEGDDDDYVNDELYNFHELVISLSLVDNATNATVDIAAHDADGDGYIDNSEFDRLIDGSLIFGTYEVTLKGGQKTTAFDMAFAHAALGYKIDSNGSIVLEGSSTRTIYQLTSGQTSYTLNDDTSLASSPIVGAIGTAANETITVDTSGNSGIRDFAIEGKAGNDTLTGGNGDDWIIGGAGIDQIHGGRGNDVLFVDGSDYVVDGGVGYDVAIAEGGSSAITLNLSTASIEAFTGGDGADTTNVTLDGSILDVFVSGLGGNDTLRGTNGDDVVLGGEGDDSIYGYGGNDYLVGGDGWDKMIAGDGDDVVVIDSGDRFYGSELLGGEGWDLVVYDDDEGQFRGASGPLGTLFLMDWGFEGAVGTSGADTISANGTSVTTTIDAVLNGRDGDDSLLGGTGDDLISGDDGDDTLKGDDGSDLYIWGRGGGDDLIIESGAGNGGRDIIGFGGGITADDIRLHFDGTDHLTITITETSGGTTTDDGSVTIYNWADTASTDKQVELLVFADGLTLDIAHAIFYTLLSPGSYAATMGSADVPVFIQGSSGADSITADDGNDIVLAGDGNDTVYGGDGHDYVSGGSGNDELVGQAGDDVLIGGDGSDTASGWEGDDYLDGGDGNDSLNGAAGRDRIIGGSGNDTVSAGTGDDIIEGGAGDDYLHGNAGDDAYIYNRGDGADLIYDDGSDNDSTPVDPYESRTGDRLVFGSGISVDDLIAGGSDVLVGAGGADSLVGGTNSDNLFGSDGNDTLDGQSGDDRLFGGDGNDRLVETGTGTDFLVGGAGNDTIQGGDNDDIYGFGWGDGHDFLTESSGSDRIQLGLGVWASDLDFYFEGNNLLVQLNGYEIGLSTFD